MTVQITPEGELYYETLQQKSPLSSAESVKFNILFDLAWNLSLNMRQEGITVNSLLSEQDTAVGRVLMHRPILYPLYAQALSELIAGGKVKATQ